jgi:tricorn protease
MHRSLWLILTAGALLPGQPKQGDYRFPALHDKTIVFTAEGDLWTVSTEGGAARRLTSHQGQ